MGTSNRRDFLINSTAASIGFTVNGLFSRKTYTEETSVGDKAYLTPNIRQTIEELLEIIELKEIKNPSRSDFLKLDEFKSRRKPSKSLVSELRSRLDPNDLVAERVTLKKSLRDKNFRVPKLISTADLVQLAIKRGILNNGFNWN